MVTFAILFGSTILIGGLLQYIFAGVPLNFLIPLVNVKATLAPFFTMSLSFLPPGTSA